jgi:uncharacterized protein
MLNLVIFGAGGQAGAAAAAEASARGHHVTALRRVDAEVTDPRVVARAAFGHEAAVVAVAPSDREPREFYRAVADSLATGLVEAGVPRLVWVSIASLLPDVSGVAPVGTDGFPAEYRPFSFGHRAALERFSRSGLTWTAVSPAGDFDRASSPHHGYTLTNVGNLCARVTYADHARAVIDLAEQPGGHVREHVGVLLPSSHAPATAAESHAAEVGHR